MNRRSLDSLALIKAITSFVNFKTTEGFSERSIDSHKRILDQWGGYAGNKTFSLLTDDDLNEYMVYMRTEYIRRRFGTVRARFLQNHYEMFGSQCARSSRGQTTSSGWKSR